LAILKTNSAGSQEVERTNTSPGELIPNQMMNQRGNEILNQRYDGMGLIILLMKNINCRKIYVALDIAMFEIINIYIIIFTLVYNKFFFFFELT